jgi:hypothetical protein
MIFRLKYTSTVVADARAFFLYLNPDFHFDADPNVKANLLYFNITFYFDLKSYSFDERIFSGIYNSTFNWYLDTTIFTTSVKKVHFLALDHFWVEQSYGSELSQLTLIHEDPDM